ncbi:hypothetical protein ACFVOR_37545 [Streptomyces sp. NPDC057837]|uniref:hypothetical protein n=1 Tax=Streptomyces sp. NPDC057837 TaxID=3346260 RepID=UPI0036A20856
MASRPLRDELQLAASLLKEAGHREPAAAVETVLAPGGWMQLRDAGSASTLTINVPSGAKETLKAKAAEFEVSLSSVAEDGYRAFLAGEWLPPRKMAASGGGGKRSVLNLRVSDELRKQVQELIPQASAKAGYKMYESTIALFWLAEEFGVDLGLAAGALRLYMRKAFHEHMDAELARRGTSLLEELEAGVREAEAGSWAASKPSWSAYGPWSKATMSQVTVRFDEDLLGRLEDLAAQFSAELGSPMAPDQVAVAVLRHRLGEPV